MNSTFQLSVNRPKGTQPTVAQPFGMSMHKAPGSEDENDTNSKKFLKQKQIFFVSQNIFSEEFCFCHIQCSLAIGD